MFAVRTLYCIPAGYFSEPLDAGLCPDSGIAAASCLCFDLFGQTETRSGICDGGGMPGVYWISDIFYDCVIMGIGMCRTQLGYGWIAAEKVTGDE